MRHLIPRSLRLLAALAALASCAFFFNDHMQERTLHTLPHGFKKFSLSDPVPPCARWKEHMPATRDASAYQIYIEARKIWRSKLEWELTREETTRILTDVRTAASVGDWGARALLAHFYLEGLGPLKSNKVLEPDPYKAVEIVRIAATAMQPWALYDLGLAYEHGYGGANYDPDLAWAYYLKAAQLGSPEAQMALAQAYSASRRLGDERIMQQCAYQQGHGGAALELAMTARINNRFEDALTIYQQGVKLGNSDCAAALWLLFDAGHWSNDTEEEIRSLKSLGVVVDYERSSRYQAISERLKINPDLKLSRLDQVLPLPPAELPRWSGVEDALTPESNDPPTY